MSDSLPHLINPWYLYRHNEVVKGHLSIEKMPNLLGSQRRTSGAALVELGVKPRDDGKILLSGSATIDLELECQRCLQDFSQRFDVSFSRVLVKYEHQFVNVNENDDVLICEEMLELAPLFEEEFILSLPMIARHSDCQMAYQEIEKIEVERQQPFAGLKDLLK